MTVRTAAAVSGTRCRHRPFVSRPLVDTSHARRGRRAHVAVME